jgi:hypothetical protein
MFQGSEVFEQHYRDYCRQIGAIDPAAVCETLAIEREGQWLRVPFFGREYRVSGEGMADADNTLPGYMTCVILAKYILLCPDRPYRDERWVSLKDFKKDSNFTNINVFSSDVERALSKEFTGRMPALRRAVEELSGRSPEEAFPWDLAITFAVLPRISLLLLFNDRDEEFPSRCSVLFPAHAEYYLDPESLIMTGLSLARKLVKKG